VSHKAEPLKIELSEAEPMTKLQDGFMYDLYGCKLGHKNAIYHAAVQLDMVDGKSVLVEMTPKATVTVGDEGSLPMMHTYERDPARRCQEDTYQMLHASNQAYGCMASCRDDINYCSPGIATSWTKTLLDLVHWWKAKRESTEWNPKLYNCQHFAKDILLQIASNPHEMDRAVQTLMHDSGTLVNGDILGASTAGSIANAFGSLTSIWEDNLEDLESESKYSDLLNRGITGYRLWYKLVTNTWGTTSKESRKADYYKRTDALCNFVTGEGQTVTVDDGTWFPAPKEL